jgi:hypothetical protein
LQLKDSLCHERIAPRLQAFLSFAAHPGEIVMSMGEPHPKPVLGGRESVKIAVAQVPSAFLDRKKTIERACATIREAAKNGASLVVFPEVWVSGYPFWTEGVGLPDTCLDRRTYALS